MATDGDGDGVWRAWAAALPTAAVVIRSGVVDEANPAACTSLELTPDELVGVALSEIMIGEIEPGTVEARMLAGASFRPQRVTVVPLDTDSFVVSWDAVLRNDDERPPRERVATTAAARLALTEGSSVDLETALCAVLSQSLDAAVTWATPDGAGLLQRRGGVGLERLDRASALADAQATSDHLVAFHDDVVVEATGVLPGVGHSVTVPVRAHGQPVGALSALRPTDAPDLRLDEIEVLHVGADQLGLIQNAWRAERAEARLAQATDDMTLFASALAHDLRAPIRHIVAFAEILRGELGDASTDALESIDRIIAAARRAGTQLNGLVDYVRGAEVHLAEVDLAAVAQDAATAATMTVESVGGRLVVDDIGGTVRSDPVVLGEVLGNLFDNAVKYRHPDRPLEVRLHVSSAPRRRMLHVSDNGLGLPEGREERAFEAFRRLHADIDEPGSGMGLAISRRLVGLLHGELHAHRLPVGTRFSIDLPRLD